MTFQNQETLRTSARGQTLAEVAHVLDERAKAWFGDTPHHCIQSIGYDETETHKNMAGEITRIDRRVRLERTYKGTGGIS
jgi:hypothetical protein